MANNGIPFSFFAKIITIMSVIILFAIMKIYISNRIYYRSREISRLEIEVSALKEENSILNMKIEKLRYKTEILDNIKIETQDFNSTEQNITQETQIEESNESNVSISSDESLSSDKQSTDFETIEIKMEE